MRRVHEINILLLKIAGLKLAGELKLTDVDFGHGQLSSIDMKSYTESMITSYESGINSLLK